MTPTVGGDSPGTLLCRKKPSKLIERKLRSILPQILGPQMETPPAQAS